MRLNKRLLLLGVIGLIAGLVGMSTSVAMSGGWSGSFDRFDGWPGFAHGSMMGWGNDRDHDEPVPSAFDDVEEYRVEAGDLFFEPSSMVIRAGTDVNITLVNVGRAFHDLTISEIDFHLNVEPGEAWTGGLAGLAAGVYTFECTVPGHAAAGMVGSLIVEA